MNERWLRFTLALTVPISFALVFLLAAIRDRQIPEVFAGGLIAILGAIVALFSVKEKRKDDND